MHREILPFDGGNFRLDVDGIQARPAEGSDHASRRQISRRGTGTEPRGLREPKLSKPS